jgi:hypothetical protein
MRRQIEGAAYRLPLSRTTCSRRTPPLPAPVHLRVHSYRPSTFIAMVQDSLLARHGLECEAATLSCRAQSPAAGPEIRRTN